jgi:hypothetical protein
VRDHSSRLNPHWLWQNIKLGDRYAIAAEMSFLFLLISAVSAFSGKALNSCNSVAGPIFTRGLCGKDSTRNLHSNLFELFVCAHVRGRLVRVAVAAMFLALLVPLAFAADGRGLPASASTPASASNSAASTLSANAASTKEPSATASSSVAPAIAEPAPTTAFVAPPPAAFIQLKQQPRTHSFFDSRNTLGFATLGASLTADALSTQKGLAYPGFVEMNPIARPFVQSRTGAAVYNAGSFGLMAGLMYWAHKTEHHKLERILPFAIGSWEGLLSARNYHVIASRPR